MMVSFTRLRALFCSVCIAVGITGAASAGSVNGGTLMTASDANQLEVWLGVGDQNFTNIWSGQAGALAASFHAAADGAGPTVAIYDVTLNSGNRVKIGGYTAVDWGQSTGYVFDATAFIFNLTTGEIQRQVNAHAYGAFSVYVDPYYFPTFGGGHDISGGHDPLGYGAYTLSYTYDHTKGQIGFAGDSGDFAGDSGYNFDGHTFNALEVYTFQPAASVPLPASGLLLIASLGGIGVLRRRNPVG